MRVIKRIIAFGLITIVIIIVAISYFLGPLFIIEAQKQSEGNKNFFSLENDTIIVSDTIPQSSLYIYIVLESVDCADNLIWPKSVFHRVFYTSDEKLVCEILKSIKLRSTGGDMATVESKMIITQNNKVIYSTGFVPDRVLGIQDDQYGWCTFTDESALINLLSQMKPYRWPVLYLD